jgi:alkanesulfonate monooxygenase SsuD/methylene tetrahydromethanopterin reductase-like flavin-dependent oxidoreductase (luciferase family)
MADTQQYNPVLFGLNIDPAQKNLQLAYSLANIADSAQLDFIGIQDHPYNAQFFDTWTLLTFLAARTRHVRFLPNVINLPLRPPAVLAKAAATLDILAEGRFELGLGAGGFWEGIASYGGGKRTPGEAFGALAEAIAIIRTLWQPTTAEQQVVVFSGQYYQLVNAQPGPTPAHPISIWLGVNRPRMLHLTGQQADGLIISSSYNPPEQVPSVQKLVDEGAQEAGRDPLAIRRAYNLMGIISQPENQNIHARRPGMIVGPVKQWIDEIVRYYYELKMDTFFFWPLMGNEQQQATIFVEEVVPGIKQEIESRKAQS